jgi:hypothetical protein
LNSVLITLPRNDRLVSQIVSLERRVSPGGRDTITHGPNGHDDLANAVAGAASLSQYSGFDCTYSWVSEPKPKEDPAIREARVKKLIAMLKRGEQVPFWRKPMNNVQENPQASQIQRHAPSIRGAQNRDYARTQWEIPRAADSKRNTMRSDFRNIAQIVAEVGAAAALLTLLGFIATTIPIPIHPMRICIPHLGEIGLA